MARFDHITGNRILNSHPHGLDTFSFYVRGFMQITLRRCGRLRFVLATFGAGRQNLV